MLFRSRLFVGAARTFCRIGGGNHSVGVQRDGRQGMGNRIKFWDVEKNKIGDLEVVVIKESKPTAIGG